MRLPLIFTLLALIFGGSPLRLSSAGTPVEIAGYAPISSGSGWVLTRDQLYLTHDEGHSWQAIGPSQAGLYLYTASFLSDGAGWLIAGPIESAAHSLMLARTLDFGAHWQSFPLSLPSAGDVEPGIAEFRLSLDSALEGALRVTYTSSSNFERWAGYRTVDGGSTWTLVDRVDRLAGGSGDSGGVFLAGQSYGWSLEQAGNCLPKGASRSCSQSARLIATSDGGQSWRAIPLPASLAEARQWTVAEAYGGIAAAASTGSHTAVVTGQGFDKCEVPTLSQLADWRAASPYTSVNLYIGGSARACKNTALSASYVRSIYNMGWTFIPTWVGPQSPCGAYGNVFSLDPSTARSQGQAEASAAADRLAWLGLAREDGSGGIAYYDMEYFPLSDATCNAAVSAFVSGWVEGLHARGSVAGVYSTGGVLRLLANLQPPIDAIWAAHWIYPSYSPDATVWNVYALTNDVWSNHQRLRQYAANPSRDPADTWTEKWGSTTMSIDSDVLDGPVALAGELAPMATPTATPTATVTLTPTATRVPFTPTAWVYLPLIHRP